jgi:hypothetical protein
MSKTEKTPDASQVVPAPKRESGADAEAVTHAEPQRGGSYTRNLETGELVPAKPDPDQPVD